MKPINHTCTLAGVLLASVVISGCGREGAPALQAGKTCTIQFRRDALGAGAALPIPPTTGSINGAETSISANFKRSTSEWVVIESKGGREIFIPKSVILLIEQ